MSSVYSTRDEVIELVEDLYDDKTTDPDIRIQLLEEIREICAECIETIRVCEIKI